MDDRNSLVFIVRMFVVAKTSGAFRFRRELILALATSTALLFVGCHPKPRAAAGTIQASVQFDPNPPTTHGPVKLKIVLSDSNGNALPLSEFAVEGDMNHAGMSPVFAQLHETAPGEYSGEIQFTMGGDWFLLLSGQLPGNTHIVKKVDVRGVKAQ